jgi:tetratricopeptide (TPR) repeat protein
MNAIDIWNDLGNLYLKGNAINSAIDAYNKAIEQGYQTGAIYKNLAGAYVSQGNIVASIPLYQKSIELLSDDKEKARVYTQLGDCYRRMADFDKAIGAFKSAIEIEPGNPALCVGLSEVQRDLEKIYGFENIPDVSHREELNLIENSNATDEMNFSNASSEFNDNLLAEDPNAKSDSPAAIESEQIVVPDETDYFRSGEVPDADVLDELTQINPESSTEAGIVNTIFPTADADHDGSTDHSDKNLVMGDETVGTAKETLDEITMSGEHVKVQGQIEDEVLEHITDEEHKLDEVVNREKEDGVRVTLLLTLGIMHWRNGNLEDADGILQSAINSSIKINNNWFEALAWHALALVKTALGDIVAAIHAYLRAVELAPDQIFPWNNIGSLYGSMGCSDKAMEAFQKAIKQNPEDSTSWDGVGDIFTKLGRLDDAIAAYQLGNIFEKTPQGDDAIKAYEKAFDFYHFTIATFENEVSSIQDSLEKVAEKDAELNDGNQSENLESSQEITGKGDSTTDSLTFLDCDLRNRTSCDNREIEPEIFEDIYETGCKEQAGDDNNITVESGEDASIDPEVDGQQPQQEMSLPYGWAGEIDDNIVVVDESLVDPLMEKKDADTEITEISAKEIKLQSIEADEFNPEIAELDLPESLIVEAELVQDPPVTTPEQVEIVSDELLEDASIHQDVVEEQIAAFGKLPVSEPIEGLDETNVSIPGQTNFDQEEHSSDDKVFDSLNCLAINPVEIEGGTFVDEIQPDESAGNERTQSVSSIRDLDEPLSSENPHLDTKQNIIDTEQDLKDEKSGTAEEILPPVVSVDPEPAPKADAERIAGTIASYEVVVKQNPQNVRAWDSLGNLYRITQRNGDAIHAFERAVLLEPSKYVFHYQLGTLYAAEGNYTDAIREIQKVVDLNPAFIFAHCALASYLRKLGQEEEAQEHISVALPFMVNEKEYDRACFESIRGNIDGALELLTIALEKKQTTIEWIRRDLDLDFIRHDSRYELLETRFSQSVVEY